jgi:hypothetical protein
MGKVAGQHLLPAVTVSRLHRVSILSPSHFHVAWRSWLHSPGEAVGPAFAWTAVGFAGLHFDLVSVAPAGDTAAAAQGRMRGTSTGPMSGQATFT